MAKRVRLSRASAATQRRGGIATLLRLVLLLLLPTSGAVLGQPAPPPAGFGSLRQDDLALVVQRLGLTVKAIPLDESVIRALAPDSYRSLHALGESKAGHLDAIARRLGLPSAQGWYVSFSTVEQGEARYDAYDFLVRSRGQDFRPLEVLPLTPGFGEGRVRAREPQFAILAFDPAIDLNQPLVLTVATTQNSAWADILRRLEQERTLIWSRAAASVQKKP
jgi:hypothetical protein